MDNKINRIIENKKIRDRLHEAGVYPVRGMIGPTGPKGDKGDGIQILGSYNTYEELIKNHPTGKPGDSYLINGDLYTWNEKNTWTNAGTIIGPTGPKGEKGEQGSKGEQGLKGETGISETINIEKIETIEPEEEAEVLDDFNQNIHNLTLRIPKGEKGNQGNTGIIGPTGPTGPQGPLPPVSCSALAFVSYMNTKDPRAMLVGNTRIIPGYTNTFVIENGTDIKINKSSVYEITLCGKISGVTSTTGASFHLVNTVDSQIVNDLTFELEKGSLPFMNFSELCFTDITAPASLQVQTNIDGSDEITFSEVNVLIKEYNV